MRQKKRDANAVREWITPKQFIMATQPRRVRPWWRRLWWRISGR